MAFWDTFAKVGAVTGAVVGVGAAAGKAASSVVNNRHKREMENREMALKEQREYSNQDFRIRELESKERRDYAKMDTDLEKSKITAARVVTRANIMYNHDGKERKSSKKVFDEQNYEAPQLTSNAMAGNGSNAQDIQKQILEAFEMKKNGIYTEEEFQMIKAKIIAGN